ncbi:MAG: NCS2 family nucleobase:cation symporter-2/xanthine permease XanP [Candidatus Azotimanducaceae bacterium]|jgi:NCS2 family nucleobase:cation symporter-2/xanthine permease XanP
MSEIDLQKPESKMLFGLEDRPPFGTALLVGLQHVLAVFGGLLVAPLIIAGGMNLSLQDTSYLVSSALVISGAATFVQIQRIGPIGSGLLSIQGTSFAFIGPLIAAFYALNGPGDSSAALGTLFGSAAVCSVAMMALSFALPSLQRVVTPNVTGTTVILLGATLVWTTLMNIQRAYLDETSGGWTVAFLALLVFVIIVVITRFGNPWMRLSSISIGLIVGLTAAASLGLTDFSRLSELDAIFIPEPARYPLGVDWVIVVSLFPIFLISMMESVGDLTATSSLSGLSTSGHKYWRRIRGGILGDATNSLMASFFCTFPNTTFSQNNGVIQLTGVASRYIGFFVAGFLVILGVFPIIGGIFQFIPDAVLYGATLLLFSMVGLAGIRIVRTGNADTGDWLLVGASVVLGWLLSLFVENFEFLPQGVVTVIQFPVTTGALIALLLEVGRITYSARR